MDPERNDGQGERPEDIGLRDSLRHELEGEIRQAIEAELREVLDQELRERLVARLKAHPAVRALIPSLEREIGAGRITPVVAMERLLAAFGSAG